MKSYIQMIVVLMVFSHVSAHAQNRKISLSANKQPLTRVLEQIERACAYTIVYSNEVVPDTMLITISAQKIPVAELLAKVLPEKQLFYKMMSERLIVIGSNRMTDEASTKKTLSGRVTDQKKAAVPFASLGLMQGNAYVSGSISNEHGYFQFVYTFKNRVKYTVKVSSVGYQSLSFDFIYPDTVLFGNIILKEEQNTLNTVNIITARPLIERKTDRYIVNVEGSALANGNTGLEVLQKSPGIWVGGDGSIKIRGNQSVMVMINDIVQRMSESDLAEYLRTLRSEDISKIEIITSPPSEFEAAGSGGIVHIVLKKARKDGLLGSVSTQYRQQVERPAYGGATSLNYKIKDLYLSGSLSAGKDESEYIATNRISYPNQDYYSSKTERYNNNGRLMYRLGLAYDLGANQSIGVQSIQTIGKLDQYFDTEIMFTGGQPLTGAARSEWFRRPSLNGTTVNYSLKMDSLGSGLKIIGDYIYSTKTELNDFSSAYTVPEKNSTYRNNTPNKTNLYSMQTDYTTIFNEEVSFKTGLKFAATKRDNEVLNESFIDGTWQINPNLSNRFIYKEYLSMAYASLEKSLHKLSIKAGLRAEHTNMNGNSVTGNEQFKRNYFSLFPSAFISWKLNAEKTHAVFFSYSRRLQRPSFSDLNPYRLQFDDFLTQLGNADLLPEYTHKLEVGAIVWNGISADVYYSLTTDKIAQLANPVANNIIEYQTRNFNNSKEYGFSLNAPIKILKWWTTNNSLAAYNLRYALNDYQIKQTTLYARSQHTFLVKNLADFDLSVDYRSPFVRANTNVAYQFVADLGLSRRFVNKSVLLRIYVSDLLNTAREKDYTEYAATRIDFYQKRPTRTFSFTMSYNFSSGKKFSNKKIEQSNEEEKNRIGN